MSVPLPRYAEPDESSDTELLDAVRSGRTSAYEVLYRRHVGSALGLARQLAGSAAEADDLVAEAFAKVLDAVRGGGGPETAFRAYLLTTVRHTLYDRARRDRRLELSDDMTRHDPGVPWQDTAVAGLESRLAARAFSRLPERWQTVLWHTEVEQESPAQVAPLLGLTPNGVAALAYRAREGLRQAYLQEHLADGVAAAHRSTVTRLGAWARGGLSSRQRERVDAHLATCGDCRMLAAEVSDVNAGLRAVVAPLVLGIGAAGYLASTAGGTAGAGAVAAAGTTAAGMVAGSIGAGGSAAGTAGTVGTAGMTGTAGTVGAGGSAAGTAGTVGTAGTISAAGMTGTAGTVGAGGSAAGTAGTVGTAGTISAAGMTGTAGGAGAAGGAAAGTAGAAAGTAGAAAGTTAAGTAASTAAGTAAAATAAGTTAAAGAGSAFSTVTAWAVGTHAGQAAAAAVAAVVIGGTTVVATQDIGGSPAAADTSTAARVAGPGGAPQPQESLAQGGGQVGGPGANATGPGSGPNGAPGTGVDPSAGAGGPPAVPGGPGNSPGGGAGPGAGGTAAPGQPGPGQQGTPGAPGGQPGPPAGTKQPPGRTPTPTPAPAAPAGTADLEADGPVGVGKMRRGGPGEVSVLVRNTGTGRASSLVATVQLPAGVSVRTGSGGWRCVGTGVATCTLVELDAGDDSRVRIKVTISDDAELAGLASGTLTSDGGQIAADIPGAVITLSQK